MLGFHHVALTVNDLDTSARWYQEVFGFEALFSEEGEQRRAVVMRVPATAITLGLVQHVGHGDAGFDPTRVGLDHVAIDVDSAEELEAWTGRLDQLGIKHSGVIPVPPGA